MVFYLLAKLRPKLRNFTEFIAKPFARLGINPNAFSASAVLFALVAGYFIMQKNFPAASIFTLFAISIDLFDGSLARLQGKTTLFGNFFETMVDKMVETVLFISAAFLHPLAAISALGFSMLCSYAKPRVALVIITDNRDWPGVGEHAERMLLFFAGILLSIFGIALSGFEIFELFLWLIALISFIGLLQRIFFAKKLIEKAEREGNVLPYLKKS